MTDELREEGFVDATGPEGWPDGVDTEPADDGGDLSDEEFAKLLESPDEGVADDPRPQGNGEGRLYDKPLCEYTSREIGYEGERLAASYLERRGYEILEKNWRTRCGEVDIIARVTEDSPADTDPRCYPEKASTVVLVEVKTRLALEESSSSMPELAVDRRKQKRYRRLALMYLATHPECESIRFDVIALNIVGERTARLRHLLGAFSWDE